MDREPLRRHDFGKPLTPIVAPLSVDPPTARWTDAQWQTIRLGVRAGSMDEKWHLFVEDRTLFFHRSWTGRGIFEAEFQRADDGWGIARLSVCGDPGHYRRTSDELDREMVVRVIDGVILGDWWS